MMTKSILIFVAIAIAQINSVYGMGSDSCSYYRFLSQPPLTLDCNPYDRIQYPGTIEDRIIWRLRMSCQVERISSDAGTFDIHWFRRDPVTQTVTNLGRLDLVNPLQANNPDELHVQYGNRDNLLNQDFREDMLGDFWCQVINTTTTPNTSLGISNILTILHPDKYDDSLATCSNIIGNKTVTCADFAEVSPIETTISSSSVQSSDQPSNGVTQILSSTFHKLQQTMLTDTAINTPPIIQPSLSLVQTNSQPIPTHTMSTSDTLIQSSSTTTSSNIPVSTKDSDTTASSGSNIIIHVAYSLTVAVIALLGLVLLAVCMSRKKIRKIFERQPVYVDMLEISHNPITHPTDTACTSETSRIQSQIIVTSIDNSNTHYEPLQLNTMDPTPEYSEINGDTHDYEAIQ